MTEHPLKIYEKLDPELLKHVTNSSEFVFAEGALPRKFKLLIGMAFDASYGTVSGVKSLAQHIFSHVPYPPARFGANFGLFINTITKHIYDEVRSNGT